MDFVPHHTLQSIDSHFDIEQQQDISPTNATDDATLEWSLITVSYMYQLHDEDDTSVLRARPVRPTLEYLSCRC
jgi:hypothetical protein